jgi:hypothetical protein
VPIRNLGLSILVHSNERQLCLTVLRKMCVIYFNAADIINTYELGIL